jgi:outer membrane lipoprotein LolB
VSRCGRSAAAAARRGKSAGGRRRASSEGALAAALLCLLAGCASLRGPPLPPSLPGPGTTWAERRVELQQRAGFAFQGRVGVAAGEEGFSAGLRWRQRAAHSSIELDGPLGIGGLRIESEALSLQVTTSRGERLDGALALAELERKLGFALPIPQLRFWVQGVPAPGGGAPVETLAPDTGRLAALEQDGWRIEYQAYAAAGQGQLPQRLMLQRERTRIRVVISSWQPG